MFESKQTHSPSAARRLNRVRRRAAQLVLAALFAVAPVFADLDQGLVGHWPLDDGSGSVAADVSPSSQNGALVGSPNWSVGPGSGALDLNGSDYVRIDDPGASPFDLTSGLSLAIWVNPNHLAGNQKLISKDNIFEFELGHAGSDRYSARLANVRRGRGQTPLVTHQWQHLVLTWDGSTVTYYYNGAPDGTATFIGTLPSNNRNIGLGARPSGYLNGAIDGARIYDRALSAAEVSDLYQAEGGTAGDLTPPVRSMGAPSGALPGGSTIATLSLQTDEASTCRYAETAGADFDAMPGTFIPGPGNSHSAALSGLAESVPLRYFVRCRDAVGNTHQDDYEIRFSIGPPDTLIGHWRLNSGSGAVAIDSSVYGHDATIYQGPSWILGQEGTALDFGGEPARQFLRVEDSGTDSALDITEALTVSAWILPEMIAGDRRILSKDLAYEFELGRTKGTYDLRLNNLVIGQGETRVALDRWQHLAATWDGSTVRYYLNGQPDGTFTYAVPLSQNNRPLGIAARPDLGNLSAGSGFFEGGLDDVRLYNRALSGTEIENVFRDTQPVAPVIQLLEPDGLSDGFTAGDPNSLVEITWVDRDPDDDATIALFYNTAPVAAGGNLIIAGLSENDEQDSYLWDVSGLAPGGYYVYAVIDDGDHAPSTAVSQGSVDIGFEVVIDEIPDVADVRNGLPVTFRAHTEPTGYEQYIDWFVNTGDRQSGRADPERGRGAEFVTILNLREFDINGSGFVWYEICAGDQCIQGDFNPFAMTGIDPGDIVIPDNIGLSIEGADGDEPFEVIAEFVTFRGCCPGFQICCYFCLRRLSDGKIFFVLIGCSDCEGLGGD